jgi:hypothetical protein
VAKDNGLEKLDDLSEDSCINIVLFVTLHSHCDYIGWFFKFHFGVGVEESIVNAPLV